MKNLLLSLPLVGAVSVYGQQVGINTDGSAPGMMLDVKTGSSSASDGIRINNPTATGDAIINFQNAGSSVWTLGFDDSDNDDFKVSQSGALGTTNALTIDGATRQILAGTDGTSGDPVWSFESDDNSGFYSSAADNISMTTGATENMRASASLATFRRQLRTRMNANSGDVLVDLTRSGDDGIVDLYRNNNLDTRFFANGESYYNGTGADNRTLVVGDNAANYPGVDMFEVHAMGSTGGDNYPINAYTDGSGDGVYVDQSGSGGAYYGYAQGAGDGIWIDHDGSGDGVYIWHAGTAGDALDIEYTGEENAIEVENDEAAPSATLVVADIQYTGGDDNYDHVAFRATSYPNDGWGIAVEGLGGYIGVYGEDMSGVLDLGYGVYAQGDMTATGTKPFTIDHPLDPENKALKHFAIESDEVLNMYRGNIELNSDGQAIVELPDYFSAINKEFSYVLTPIGTPSQPYVLSEVEGNEFTVGGEPNTKVSWVIYAQRNDAYIQKYPHKAKSVVDKPDRMKGKYFDPVAHDQPRSKHIMYIAPDDKEKEDQKRAQLATNRKRAKTK